MSQGYRPGWGPHAGLPAHPAPRPTAKRGAGPFILGALLVLAAVMIGLVLYALFSGPDYQNDDYVPPPAGEVQPLPLDLIDTNDLNTFLVDNPLYAHEVPTPVRCELTNADMDITTASDDEVHAYIDDVMGCTMRVWDPPFRATGVFELVRPVVNIYHDSVQTPCGGGRANGPNASYCSANQQVYFSRSLPDAHPNLAGVAEPHAVDLIMAHEFAHAMQARSTIIFLAHLKSRQAADPATGLEHIRRIELQADCFAGQYISAVQQSAGYTDQDLDRMQRLMFLIGDDGLSGQTERLGNHGQGVSREYWYQLGRSSTDIGVCNTFTAPPDYVR